MSDNEDLAKAIGQGRALVRFRRKMKQLGMKRCTFYLSDGENDVLKNFLSFLRGEYEPQNEVELEIFSSFVETGEVSYDRPREA